MSSENPMKSWTYQHEHDPLLHQAAFYGDLRRLRSLMKDGDHQDDIDKKNRLGCTPLRLAATAGHTKCVSYLLEHGANIEATDIKGQTALFVAIKNKRLDCLRILLKHGANPNGSVQCLCTPVYIAAMEGFHAGIQELVEYNADLNLSQPNMGNFFSTPLYIAIAYERLSCFKELLLGGADPDFTSRTASLGQNSQSLYHAVIKHNVDVNFAELLYQFGANLYVKNSKGQYPWNMQGYDNACRDYILGIHDMPRSLMGHCRLCVKRCLGRRTIQLTQKLPLPNKLQDYIMYIT